MKAFYNTNGINNIEFFEGRNLTEVLQLSLFHHHKTPTSD